MTVHAVGARIPVSDLNAAEAFYVDGFGLEVAFRDDEAGTAVLRSPSGYLLLTVDAAASTPPKPMSGFGPPVALLLVPFCFEVTRRLRERGLQTFPADEPAWGGMQADFIDPFGNHIALYSLGG